MVEPVDPLQRSEFEFIAAAPGTTVVDQFRLVEPDHRLCQGVVIGVAAAALAFLATVPASAEKAPPPPATHTADADGDKIFDDLERLIGPADVDQTFPAIVLLNQLSPSD